MAGRVAVRPGVVSVRLDERELIATPGIVERFKPRSHAERPSRQCAGEGGWPTARPIRNCTPSHRSRSPASAV